MWKNTAIADHLRCMGIFSRRSFQASVGNFSLKSTLFIRNIIVPYKSHAPDYIVHTQQNLLLGSGKCLRHENRPKRRNIGVVHAMEKRGCKKVRSTTDNLEEHLSKKIIIHRMTVSTGHYGPAAKQVVENQYMNMWERRNSKES